ncbi:DUF4113 domain-containing protein [Halomonas chromatireducens]
MSRLKRGWHHCQGAAWHLRCDNLTQRYSTRWEELPAARAT